MDISYHFGDITEPFGSKPKIILNVCPPSKNWEEPNSLIVSRKFKKSKKLFDKWVEDSKKSKKTLKENFGQTSGSAMESGAVQIVDVTKRGWIFGRSKPACFWVANIVVLKEKEKVGKYSSNINIAGLIKAFKRVASFAKIEDAVVHLPRFDQTSKWELIEEQLRKNFSKERIGVIVYDI